jgi:hypothetical protein
MIDACGTAVDAVKTQDNGAVMANVQGIMGLQENWPYNLFFPLRENKCYHACILRCKVSVAVYRVLL